MKRTALSLLKQIKNNLILGQRLYLIALQDSFIFRLNFLFLRLRNIFFLLSITFLWLSLYQDGSDLFGYSKEKMLTYIIFVALLKGIVLGTKTNDLAPTIKNGELTFRYLIRPWNIAWVWFCQDWAAKSIDLFFLLPEVFFIAFIVGFSIWLPHSLLTWLIFIILVFLAVIFNFLFRFIISLSGFWWEEVWAPNWLFGIVLLEIFSGVFFPLDILPSLWQKVIYWTPFPYLLFFPVKFLLGQVSSPYSVILILLIWIFLAAIVMQNLWRRGLKTYSAFGG